jgi:hypothetical protein
VPQPDETLSRVRLRTGRELTVVNISVSGVLLEGATRLLPGTRAEVHVVTRHGRVLVRTKVVRSLVWRLQPDVVWYRTALAFDTDVDTDAQSDRTEGKSVPGEFRGNDADPGIGSPGSDAETRV